MQSVKLVESGNSDVAKSSLIKGFVTKLGREAAHLGRELLGGNGILLEYKIMRCLADMEVAYTYEGTYDINMLVAARAITGISSFKSPFQLKN